MWPSLRLAPISSSSFNTGGSNGGYENNIGAPCGNGSNRTYTVSGSAVVPTFCYNSCIDCGATNVFTGATSTDFNTGSNWNSGLVPNSCTANIQVNGSGVQPSIAAAANFSVGSVALMSGANLTLGAGASLSVCGTLSGTGGQTTGGALIVNGPTSQTMTGSATYDNLTVSKTGGQGNLTVNGNARIKGNLTLANATSNLTIAGGGSVTLASTATGTGRLTAVPVGATITGNLTLERYISGTPGWRFMGAPFTSSTLISDWNEDAVRISPKNNANVFNYTEADTTRASYNGYLTERAGWKVPAALSNPINPGNVVTGYRLYAGQTFLNYSRTLVVSGSPFIGDKGIPYTFSAGHRLGRRRLEPAGQPLPL